MLSRSSSGVREFDVTDSEGLGSDADQFSGEEERPSLAGVECS